MTFVTVDGFGGGNFTPDGNLAEWIDRTLLGRFRDGASVENGVWSFAPGTDIPGFLAVLISVLR